MGMTGGRESMEGHWGSTGFPQGLRWQGIFLQCRRLQFDPWDRKMLWRRAWQPTPVFLPGESQGQRSPAGYGPQGRIGSDVQLTLSLACENRPHQPHLEPRPFSSQEAAPPRALTCPRGVLGRQCWRQGWDFQGSAWGELGEGALRPATPVYFPPPSHCLAPV